MEEQERYTIGELYDDLPCTLVDLAKMAQMSEVTVARIRDGQPTRRSTANRLLRALSEIYGRPLSLRNVRGITLQVNQREAARQRRKQEEEAA